VCKNTHRHDTRPLADFALERQRIGNVEPRHIDDVLTVVGHQRHAITFAHLRNAAHRSKLPHDPACGHRDDLYRQRKRAQHIDQFRRVGNADETLRLRCHDFFARERRATALDHEAMAIDLVGPVDVDGNIVDFIAVEHRNAQRAQTLGRGQRTGDGALDVQPDGRQRLNELVHRGAGPDTDDGAAHHVIERRAADLLLELILCECRCVGRRRGDACGRS